MKPVCFCAKFVPAQDRGNNKNIFLNIVIVNKLTDRHCEK